jgi:threonine dehydratase
MTTYNNILEAIGSTPLIRLHKIAQDILSPIYIKAEFLNPGGSTKDRIALTIIPKSIAFIILVYQVTNNTNLQKLKCRDLVA